MDSDFAGIIDRIVRPEVEAGGAGAALAILKDGQTIAAQGWGAANLEWNAPASANTVFPIASITKPITALAVAMLVEEGRLDLDRPIRDYLEVAPTDGHRISARHLLTHTSGLRAFNLEPGFGQNGGRVYRTASEMHDVACSMPCDFAPGAQYRYSNTGYVLLRSLIERASGQRYPKFLQDQILNPAGMSRTCLYNEHMIVPERASGYEPTERGLRNAYFQSMTWPGAAGSVASTVLDLARLDNALREHALLREASFREMLRPVRLSNGDECPYGLGWGLGTYHGRACHAHIGGLAGFSGEWLRFDEPAVSIVLLTNISSFPVHRVALALARTMLGIPPDNRPFVRPDVGNLRQWVGDYFGADGAVATVALVDGDLQVSWGGRRIVRYLEDGLFRADEDPDVEYKFERNPASPTTLTISTPLLFPVRLDRAER